MTVVGPVHLALDARRRVPAVTRADSGGGGGFTFFADSRGVFCISFRILWNRATSCRSSVVADDDRRALCLTNSESTTTSWKIDRSLRRLDVDLVRRGDLPASSSRSSSLASSGCRFFIAPTVVMAEAPPW